MAQEQAQLVYGFFGTIDETIVYCFVFLDLCVVLLDLAYIIPCIYTAFFVWVLLLGMLTLLMLNPL
jgi:hypothetical protein